MNRPAGPVLLEICVDDAAGLEAAVAGGADRIELCSALALGGLTPTPGLVDLARSAPVPVYAMIRPQAGGFVFSPADIRSMRADIDRAREAGLAGVVLGASRPDGRLDVDALSQLVAHARGLGLTLHRAFDLVPDFAEAVEIAVALGFERILSSGGRPGALEGIEALGRIAQSANGRISIMPGSGIRADNVRLLLDSLPIREIHSSGSVPRAPSSRRAVALGFEPRHARLTDAAAIRELRRRL